MTNKHNQNSNDAAGLFVALIFVLPIYAAMGKMQKQFDKTDFYTPGETIRPKERATVETLQDSVLNARMVRYEELHNKYKNARGCAPRTQEIYRTMLNKYARDSVETRYQELCNMLNTQKSKQK